MRHLSLKYESLTVYIYFLELENHRDICLNKEGYIYRCIVLNYRYQWRAVLIFFSNIY